MIPIGASRVVLSGTRSTVTIPRGRVIRRTQVTVATRRRIRIARDRTSRPISLISTSTSVALVRITMETTLEGEKVAAGDTTMMTTTMTIISVIVAAPPAPTIIIIHRLLISITTPEIEVRTRMTRMIGGGIGIMIEIVETQAMAPNSISIPTVAVVEIVTETTTSTEEARRIQIRTAQRSTIKVSQPLAPRVKCSVRTDMYLAPNYRKRNQSRRK